MGRRTYFIPISNREDFGLSPLDSIKGKYGVIQSGIKKHKYATRREPANAK